jgi:hemerythrin-like domain-containing protein
MASETNNEPRDFFASLQQEHARMETRLAALLEAANSVGAPESDAASLQVIARTLEYFATEGARHEAVEEKVLFPRLRPLPEFKQMLSALEFQHRMNHTATQELAACVARFEPASGRELRRLASRFAEMHRGHAIAEERALFPLAASVLSSKVLVEMGRELRERERAAGATAAPQS